jgi:glycosyltransferase involved in cell wall biosynthesis
MIEVERIDPRRIRFVPNGIPQASRPDRAAARTELGIPPGVPLIGIVASLRPQKALHVLIECALVLARDFPDLHVLIVGEGPERARLESLIRARGLTRTVFMLGHRSDVTSVLSALDVAVLTSDWEGSPLAVLEYMAAGCPVVATKVGGVPDIVRHGVDGLLAEARDVNGLAGAIAHLLRRPERRARMGANGRRRQLLEFSIDQMVWRIETLYEELFRGAMRAKRCGAAFPGR